jgi:hypothetical protein
MNSNESAFLSYAHRDSEFAPKLANDLRSSGASIWIDQLDIKPGESWDPAVQQALETCPATLVILSPDAVQSDNVLGAQLPDLTRLLVGYV